MATISLYFLGSLCMYIATVHCDVFDATSTGQWQNKAIDCAEGQDCTVNCVMSNACNGANITCPTNGKCTIQCTSYGCQYANIICSPSSQCDVDCNGGYSCRNVDFEWPTVAGLGSLTCYGTYSCYGVTFPVPNPNVDYSIMCGHSNTGGSQYMCAYATMYCPTNINANCSINCDGGNSANECNYATVILPYQNPPRPHAFSMTCTSNCHTISFPGAPDDYYTTWIETQYQHDQIICNDNKPCTIQCTQESGCKNATIRCPANARCDISCTSYTSCQLATIICPPHSECNVECKQASGYVCDRARFTWPLEEGLGTLSCHGAYACREITFPRPDPQVALTVDCSGSKNSGALSICYGSTIYCPRNASCTLNCNGGSTSYECANTTVHRPHPGSQPYTISCDNSCHPETITYEYYPTAAPTSSPTSSPSAAPTFSPSGSPSAPPTAAPSFSPSNAPSDNPSDSPTSAPSMNPSSAPSTPPTNNPSSFPSNNPTWSPSRSPSNAPSNAPSVAPSSAPSTAPTSNPSPAPSARPTEQPTIGPTSPTITPSVVPTVRPTRYPTPLNAVITYYGMSIVIVSCEDQDSDYQGSYTECELAKDDMEYLLRTVQSVSDHVAIVTVDIIDAALVVCISIITDRSTKVLQANVIRSHVWKEVRYADERVFGDVEVYDADSECNARDNENEDSMSAFVANITDNLVIIIAAIVVCICGVCYFYQQRKTRKELMKVVQMSSVDPSSQDADTNEAGEGGDTEADTFDTGKKEPANVVPQMGVQVQGGMFIPMQMNAPFVPVPMPMGMPVPVQPGENADLPLPPQPEVRDTMEGSDTDEDDEMYDNEDNEDNPGVVNIGTSGGQGVTEDMNNNLLGNNEQDTVGNGGFETIDNVEPVLSTPDNE